MMAAVACIVDGKACARIGVACGTRTRGTCTCFAAHADRIDTTRRSRGCIARIAIQSQSRRFDMTSINASASLRFTACMTPPVSPRGIVRFCIAL
ncbi:hypothetical protein D7S92_23165 [Burkholderia contaminans]|jgi:hypothetical protein|nr:hypothetical protein [Burkholderia contaminans]MBA9906128.1 hypothetical protein [Burkholderia contaminans]MCB4327711.1 hypothetical protein [Burkholderia contaminans]RDT03457.1 hypothetical protein DWU95_11625 [Burkholderia contaminans]